MSFLPKKIFVLINIKTEKLLQFKKIRNFQKILKVELTKTAFDDTTKATRYFRIV